MILNDWELNNINNSFCVQGICFYNNELYLSSSLGKNKSVISIFNKDLKLTDRRIINQHGIEGIIIKNKTLYSLYEMGKQQITSHNISCLNELTSKAFLLKIKYLIAYRLYKRLKARKQKKK